MEIGISHGSYIAYYKWEILKFEVQVRYTLLEPF